MTLYFNLDYNTTFGEELVLNVVNRDGGTDVFRMSTIDGKHWWYEMNIADEKLHSPLTYFYSLHNAGAERRREWTTVAHQLDLTVQKAGRYTMYDHWMDIPEDTYLYSSAFTDCVNRRETVLPATSKYGKTLRIIVRAPQLRSYERLALLGSGMDLGNWNTHDAIAMTEHNHNEWMVDLNAAPLEGYQIEFKFIAVNASGATTPLWETGYNRTIDVPRMEMGDVVCYSLDQAFFPICDRKLAGTLVPVFSLRSKTSFGVGDFGDLTKMIDFVASTGQRVLQVLPINDTTSTHTWTDSYPYSCISIFALHPQYVDLTQLPKIADADKREQMETLRKELNALPQIDYERVNNAKNDYLRTIYEQERAKTMRSAEFKTFFKENSQWLVPYAQYCLMRDTYGTGDFNKWPDHNTWDEADRKALSTSTTKAYRQVEFYYYVQYILNAQMEAVHEHARRRGVILKGDIPIGVARHGCDVWMEPNYFNMNGQAGAPPDDFSVNGQNWGFPTYNWDAMIADGCTWWVRRFQNMAKYFDAYRIDHVLGFFRIWEIPINSVHGLLGQFSPSLAMTREEIEAYGLHFQDDFFLRPFIADWVLDRIFKEHADEVKEKYLVHAHDDIWNLREEYDTQRKIEAAFEGKTSETDVWIRDGLYALVSNVLFVRDRKDANKFHPRISAQLDFTYEALWDSDKAAFNRLYNDYYYRRNNQFWYYEAMKKLPRLVEATRMLVCAEDLGMVPDCVAWVMKELRILSLELESMPKDPSVKFGYLSRNPYRSVCTISSHDMPTLRQWWDEDWDRTQDYFSSMLGMQGKAPHPMPGWLAQDIISRHLASPSMLCVLSIQDWLAIDEQVRLADQNAERINIPANPKHYWRYRMHLNIEDMMMNGNLTTHISELIAQNGRK